MRNCPIEDDKQVHIKISQPSRWDIALILFINLCSWQNNRFFSGKRDHLSFAFLLLLLQISSNGFQVIIKFFGHEQYEPLSLPQQLDRSTSYISINSKWRTNN